MMLATLATPCTVFFIVVSYTVLFFEAWASLFLFSFMRPESFLFVFALYSLDILWEM